MAENHRAVTLPVPLSSLRLGPQDAADLRWLLLEDWRGDLGVKSNFGDMLERLARERAGEPDPDSWHVIPCHETRTRKPYAMDEKMLRAAERLDELLWRWRGISVEHRESLRLVYGETRAPPREWGDLWPLALRSSVADAAFARAKDKRGLVSWLTRLPARAAQASLTAAIRRDAEQRLVVACRAWERTYRGRRARAA